MIDIDFEKLSDELTPLFYVRKTVSRIRIRGKKSRSSSLVLPIQELEEKICKGKNAVYEAMVKMRVNDSMDDPRIQKAVESILDSDKKGMMKTIAKSNEQICPQSRPSTKQT